MCNPLQKLKMKSLPTTGGETDLYSHPGKILLNSRLKTLADPFDSEAAAAADPTAWLAEHSICLQPGLTPCAQHSFSHRAEPRRRRGRTKDPQLLKAPAGPACIWGGAGGCSGRRCAREGGEKGKSDGESLRDPTGLRSRRSEAPACTGARPLGPPAAPVSCPALRLLATPYSAGLLLPGSWGRIGRLAVPLSNSPVRYELSLAALQ